MVLILVSWIYITLTAIHLGLVLSSVISLKNNRFFPVLISGLFAASLLSTLWAVFGRIHLEFHVFLAGINALVYLKKRRQIHQLYAGAIQTIQRCSWPIKVALVSIGLMILAQCSTAPFVIDNETYYIQTIKWLNQYGLVPGLANLHISLGQVSGWHLLQSAFSFSFLYAHLNDLSGFCLLMGNTFALVQLDRYFKSGNQTALLMGLFPLANVLFFQLISAPSPDVPICVLSFVLFYYFIEDFKSNEVADFNFLALLGFFILFIKITALALILIPVLILWAHFHRWKKQLLPIGLLGLLTLVLFVTKNALVSGLPFFPLTFGRLPVDFAVPLSSAEFYFNSGKMCLFFVTPEEYQSMSVWQIALKWLFASKISGFFNLSTVLILLLSPIFIYKFYHQRALWWIYLVAVVEFVLLLLSSPVYRYFIYLTLFFGYFIFICVLNHPKTITAVYVFSVLATGFVLLFPLDFDRFTKNKLIRQNSSFSVENMIFPHQNSKLNTAYRRVQNGNLRYYSPVENPFFWANGDGNLPCVNQAQIDYFQKNLGLVPQMRGQDLSDGFYTQITPKQ